MRGTIVLARSEIVDDILTGLRERGPDYVAVCVVDDRGVLTRGGSVRGHEDVAWFDTVIGSVDIQDRRTQVRSLVSSVLLSILSRGHLPTGRSDTHPLGR
jgi:hypothetical protein